MIDAQLSFGKFLAGWVPALALSASVSPPAPSLGDMFLIDLGGVPVPVVTCVLAAMGIGMARPFAHRAEAKLGWPLFALVTLVLLTVAQLWVIESRPSWLFAFVVAFGMGFSGYSLLEMFGEQVKDIVRHGFEKARATFGLTPKGDDK